MIWSSARPCVFYLLDSGARLHLWDLGAGDIYPAHTVQFGDTVTCCRYVGTWNRHYLPSLLQLECGVL